MRVSTEEQAKKGYSIQDQLRDCRRVAGADAVREYVDEGVTGEFLDRPALSRLREDVRSGLITRVICLDPDRLSRKLMNQLIISEEIEKRAELVFVNGEYRDTPEGRLFYQMRGAISEFEKAKINERMCRGRREKARQGKVVRDYSIYGYDYDRDSSSLVVNEYEAGIVKLIFELFTAKEKSVQGMNGIAKFLTERGIPTKRGAKVWHKEVIRQILLNRTYIGEFYQNRWFTEGMLGNKFRSPEDRISMKERPKEDWILVPCPVIIERNVFEYAQELLKESRRRWAGMARYEYLLSGLVRCGLCGNTMTGRRWKNWGKYIFYYTDIKATAGAKFKGCGMKVQTAELEEKVWEVVKQWLEGQDGQCTNELEPEKEDDFFEKAELDRIDRKLEEITKGRQNIISFLASAGDSLDAKSMEDIRVKLSQLKEEEEQLQTRKNELVSAMEDNGAAVFRQNIMQEALEYYLSKAPEEITFQDKKELIRFIVREVRVYKNEIKVFGF